MTTESLLNLIALQQAVVNQEPYPYLTIPNFINSAFLSELVSVFPNIHSRGSIPAATAGGAPLFQQLVAELEGPALKKIIAEKFNLDLQNKPTMLTLRGNTTERDGQIHTDSKSKLITVLLYMNPTWSADGGKLRVLKNKDSLEDYSAEIEPLAGHCLIFKVTPNCWHGHKPFVGKRLSLQLNYLASSAALTKHVNHHRFTAVLKRWFPRVFKNPQQENY